MIRLANVLIVDGNHDRSEEMRARLGHAGYHASTVPTGVDALGHLRHEHPDLVIVADPADGDAIELGAQIKNAKETNDIPVLLLAPEATAEVYRRVLAAGLDDVLTPQCDDSELNARLRPLVRLETMHAELRQRALVAGRFGIAARERVSGPIGAAPALLLIGDRLEKVHPLLADLGEVAAAADLFEAEDQLGRRNFDAAVVSFGEDPEGLLGFCSQVRNNPRLFNLPMVLLTPQPANEAYRRGATRVLPPTADPAVLHSVVLSLVRRQQLRWAIRGALNDSLAPATRDPLTGAYGRAFFDAYLASRLELAKEQDRHLAVVFFAAPNIDGVRRQFGDDAALHLTQQVGQWITGLLRAEDLTAAYAPNEFCVVLPDTPLVEAEVVMHRIAGVLAYTDFAVREVYQPVKVWVQVGCTDVRNDDTVVSLLARARGNID